MVKVNFALDMKAAQHHYVGTVADCSYVRTFEDRDLELVKAEIISNWNKASAIYEKTFNVSLVLVQVIILKECNSGEKSSLSIDRAQQTTQLSSDSQTFPTGELVRMQMLRFGICSRAVQVELLLDSLDTINKECRRLLRMEMAIGPL